MCRDASSAEGVCRGGMDAGGHSSTGRGEQFCAQLLHRTTDRVEVNVDTRGVSLTDGADDIVTVVIYLLRAKGHYEITVLRTCQGNDAGACTCRQLYTEMTNPTGRPVDDHQVINANLGECVDETECGASCGSESGGLDYRQRSRPQSNLTMIQAANSAYVPSPM